MPRRCASCGGIMRLGATAGGSDAPPRALADQRHRFTCTSCGRTVDLQSDHGLVVSGLGASGITLAAVGAVLGHSGPSWALGFSFSAFFLDALFASELLRRLRHPKLA